jgi:hypothetical protein
MAANVMCGLGRHDWQTHNTHGAGAVGNVCAVRQGTRLPPTRWLDKLLSHLESDEGSPTDTKQPPTHQSTSRG